MSLPTTSTRAAPDASTIGCASDQPHANPSPIWDANLCPTWVSLPVVITVTNGKTGADQKIYRHRDGRSAICDNASVTHLEEDLGNGQVAETELTYDAWGSYDRIVYPVGGNGRRYSVQYVWDLGRARHDRPGHRVRPRSRRPWIISSAMDSSPVTSTPRASRRRPPSTR